MERLASLGGMTLDSSAGWNRRNRRWMWTWAPAWRRLCCPSGWPASMTTGESSSIQTRTWWSPTVQRTGGDTSTGVTISRVTFQVPSVLLQLPATRQEQQGPQGHYPHHWHKRSEGDLQQCWCGRWSWRAGGGSPGAGHSNKVSLVWWSTNTNSDNVICQVGGSSRQLEWNYALRLEFAELDIFIFSQEKFGWFKKNFVYVVCWPAK